MLVAKASVCTVNAVQSQSEYTRSTPYSVTSLVVKAGIRTANMVQSLEWLTYG